MKRDLRADGGGHAHDLPAFDLIDINHRVAAADGQMHGFPRCIAQPFEDGPSDAAHIVLRQRCASEADQARARPIAVANRFDQPLRLKRGDDAVKRGAGQVALRRQFRARDRAPRIGDGLQNGDAPRKALGALNG